MWNKVENGTSVKPSTVDNISSRKYVYVRKEITYVEETDERPAHYEWLEMKIPKDDWAVYQGVIAHDEALDDVYAALAELAALVTEV